MTREQTLRALLLTAMWELVYGAGEDAIPAIKRLLAKGATLSEKPTFNRAVDEAFAKCTGVSNQRGTEYADSWHVNNQSTHFLNATLALIYDREGGAEFSLCEMSRESKRLLMLASMCDVKISRMGGAWKADTFEDLLNYTAAYYTLAAEYQAPKPHNLDACTIADCETCMAKRGCCP